MLRKKFKRAAEEEEKKQAQGADAAPVQRTSPAELRLRKEF